MHQLHREVLYERVPAGRRARYHRAVGHWLEAAYGGQADEHVGELALHFDRGGDAVRAVDCLCRTAGQAMVRGAAAEALGHLDAALGHASRMPDGDERRRAELNLQLMRASALIVTWGWAAPELESAYRRAAELCRRLADPPEAQFVTVGLAALEEMRGHHRRTEELLEPRVETGRGPSVLAVETYELLACSAFHQGRFERAIAHARRGLARHRPEANEEYARHGVDPVVHCHEWAALSSWFLGRSGDAVSHVTEARAVGTGPPHAEATAGVVAAFFHHYRDEPVEARHWAETTVALAAEHGYPFRLVQGRILRGWAAAACGEGDDGLAELGAGLEGYQSTGASIEWPHFLGMLADALLRAGRASEALDHLAEALAAVATGRDSFYEPELHRLYAAALLAVGGTGATEEAEAALHQGLERADAQRSPTARLRLLLARWDLGGAQSDQEQLRRRIEEAAAAFPEEDRAPDLVRARAL